jgi:hypothetical protein
MMVAVKRKIGCCYTRWRRLSPDHYGPAAVIPRDPLTRRFGPLIFWQGSRQPGIAGRSGSTR